MKTFLLVCKYIKWRYPRMSRIERMWEVSYALFTRNMYL